MPPPDSFSVFDSDLQKAVSTTKSEIPEIPEYDPTLFDDNSQTIFIDEDSPLRLERVNMVAMANTGLLIIPYTGTSVGSYLIKILYPDNLQSVKDLISIFNISSTTPKKFIKVIQTGKNVELYRTDILLWDGTGNNFVFKQNGSEPGNFCTVEYKNLISGILVYVESGKFVFDFQTFFIRNS
jgi:hypothetical protein